MHDYIACQPYTKTQRVIGKMGLEQQFVEEERMMYLYYDKIVTQYHEFPLDQIFDVSFKGWGKEGGIVYIHTSHGVYTYNVDRSPERFINAYRHLKKST